MAKNWESAPHHGASKPARVLIVDDDECNIKLFETLLHAEGYATLTARNGRKALVVAATEQPDMILLDVMMPDMDGFATVEHLKADPTTQPVPVIMITSLDDRESKQRALESGAEDIAKPIHYQEFLKQVAAELRE